MTKYEAADKAMAAYDSALFGAIGKGGMSDKLNTLAAEAAVACQVAARDRSVNQATRDFYRPLVEFFNSQVLA